MTMGFFLVNLQVKDWCMTEFKRALCFSLLGILMACGYPEVEIEEGYFSPAKMQAILLDLHLVEGAKAGKTVVGDTLPVAYYYEALYRKHNISEEELDSNLRYYARNQKMFDSIYNNVINELTQIEAQLETDRKEENKKNNPTPPDSLIFQAMDSLDIKVPGKKKIQPR